jgi:hypothetical protein
METPIVCPVCWNHAVSLVEGTKLTATNADGSRPITKVSVYRCVDWHIFALFDNPRTFQEVTAQI